MKLALLADVHSNLEALDACMRHARREGAERFVFLGDIVGYGADPGAVVDVVAAQVAAGGLAVKGNHDDAVRNAGTDLNDDARAAIDWTRGRLDHAQAAFLDGLPLIVREDGVCWVHASANSPGEWNYVTDDLQAARSMGAAETTWCFSGHVHDQVLYYQGAGRRLMAFRPLPGVPIPVGRHRRWLAIVGSAGQPRDGNSAAAYALFDTRRAQLVFHRVPYDHEAASAKILAAGLPASLARRLRDGH
ncbi:MAG: metallophosphoesterase family protein [Burkholderiaceae bacterium]